MGRLASVVVAAAVLAVVPGSAFAHGGDRNGRIAWSQFTDDISGTARIVSANPGGSGFRVLTHPEEGSQDIDPKVSPNGRGIVFERDTPDGSLIGFVGSDGSGERIIDTHCVAPCEDDIEPTWTPDGRHIAFTRVVGPFTGPGESAVSAVLWTTDLGGRHLRRLSPQGIDGVYEDYIARWTPDGRTLTFLRVRNEPFNSALFARGVNGRHERQLTPWEIDADIYDVSQARWGPTKGLLAFETFGHGAPEGQSSNVATVPVGCREPVSCTTKIRYLTDNGAGPVGSFNPAWSPDGSRIVFAEYDGDVSIDLWIFRPDGSDREQFTTNPPTDFRPVWGVMTHDRRW
jgi:Tol biopolymer transport system component